MHKPPAHNPSVPSANARSNLEENVLAMPPLEPRVGELVYERFRKQKLPTFDESHDPAEAENWVKRLQQIFTYMRLADNEHVAYVVNQLDAEARCSWEIMVQPENVKTLTWSRFLKLFYEKYLDEARLFSKVCEFMKLQQCDMSPRKAYIKVLKNKNILMVSVRWKNRMI